MCIYHNSMIITLIQVCMAPCIWEHLVHVHKVRVRHLTVSQYFVHT